jgi:hypothetical protein
LICRSETPGLSGPPCEQIDGYGRGWLISAERRLGRNLAAILSCRSERGCLEPVHEDLDQAGARGLLGYLWLNVHKQGV